MVIILFVLASVTQWLLMLELSNFDTWYPHLDKTGYLMFKLINLTVFFVNIDSF